MKKIIVHVPLGVEDPQPFIGRIQKCFPGIDSILTETEAAFASEIIDADAVITWGPRLTDDLVGSAKRLKWIHSLITGYDWLSKLPSLGKDVMVTRSRIYGHPMAETALMMMLALSRDLPAFQRNQSARIWERWSGTLLYRKTVGILGIGAIGEALSKKLKGLEMNVIGISETPRDIPTIDRFVPRDNLREISGELDYLVVVVPLSDDTRHIVNREVLHAMKPTAYLVNIARGHVVDEDALLEVLREGKIAGAGLDVFATEPLPADHPFWGMQNVIVTPHCAGGGDMNVSTMLDLIEHNSGRFLDGRYDEMIDRVR